MSENNDSAAALEEFGEHKNYCASSLRYPSPPCDCGLEAAIQRARTRQCPMCYQRVRWTDTPEGKRLVNADGTFHDDLVVP